MPKGFRAAGVRCGLKPSGALDLALVVSDRPCTTAAVTTTNRSVGAPVVVVREHLRHRGTRAIVCNSGNANVATGRKGHTDAISMTRQVAERIGCAPHHVLPASTGVIGHMLDMKKIGRGIDDASDALDRGGAADANAATAILTTDLVAKPAHRRIRLGRHQVTIGGIAKGSGMIAPNMATMLAFVTTDADVARPVLARALRRATADSFNRISVDQHTSPSDMVIVLANGAAGNPRVATEGAHAKKLADAIADLCSDLAYQIVRDGEGANRVIRVTVRRASSRADADRVAQAVVNSPLVKTAVHGGDPNWGRIVTAAGYSGAALDTNRLSLHIGPKRDACVFRRGGPVKLDAKQTRRLERLMRGDEVRFTLDLGLGTAETEWLGCDLSRDYVRINADYTT